MTWKYRQNSRKSSGSCSKSRCAYAGLGYSLSRKWCGTIFRPRSSKVCVQKLVLCEFHCKPWSSGVSLESPGLQKILQVPGKRAEVDQNHDARNAVSATVSVLKWSVAIFRPTSSKVSVQKVLLCPFHCKARPSGVSIESPGLENFLQVPGNAPKFMKITMRVTGSRLFFQSQM